MTPNVGIMKTVDSSHRYTFQFKIVNSWALSGVNCFKKYFIRLFVLFCFALLGSCLN